MCYTSSLEPEQRVSLDVSDSTSMISMRLWRFSTEFDVCDEFGKWKNVTDEWSSRTDMVWFAHWDVEATKVTVCEPRKLGEF